MSSNVKKINLQEMKDAISRSGYLIEQRIEPIVEARGFFIETDTAFKDLETGKSREIDIYALSGTRVYRNESDSIFPIILCACNNNSQPVVFFKRDPVHSFLFYENVKYSGIPVKFFVKDGFVSLAQYMGLGKFHHYCKGPFSTQYCTFHKKRGKDPWIASRTEEQQEVFTSLIKALNSTIDEHYDIWEQSEKRKIEDINIQIYYPLIVFQGDIYEAYVEDNNLKLGKTNHMQFIKRNISQKGKETYQFDVVNERYLTNYLDIVKKEMERIKKKFSRKRRDVERTLEKLSLQIRRKRRSESYRDILEFQGYL